jgi:hypothetical protein
MPQVSFSTDIKPLFRAIDISHMRPFGVELDNYTYMSNPDNANLVLATLSPHDGEPPTMPPGGPYWTAAQLTLFAEWQKDGYQPWAALDVPTVPHSIPLGEYKAKGVPFSVMDEGRKRVIGIMAAILASLHMQTADDLFGTPQGSPRTDKLIAASVQWAVLIMKTIDAVCGKMEWRVPGPGFEVIDNSCPSRCYGIYFFAALQTKREIP